MLRKSTLEITGVSTAQNGRKEESWRFTVITPMIGGDAEQWKLNKEAPVRTQSVKGMLRFWWRALQESCNAEELLKREQRIWGGGQTSDGRCSPIRIWIDQPGAGSVRWENPERPAYVYFPIVQSFKKPEDYRGGVAAAGFSFVLHASYPLNTSDNINYEKELHDTLLMWMLFGGVGARTRRGCGSLFCKELCDEYKIKNIKDIQRVLASLAKGDDKLGKHPRLKNAQLYYAQGDKSANVAAQWSALMESYAGFRQKRNGKFGPSFWPEPNCIRVITKAKSPNSHPANLFPRGAFGLPIIFHFPPGKKDIVGDFTLQPVDKDKTRFPSPVIIKMIKTPDAVYKVCIILNVAFCRLELKIDDKYTYCIEKQQQFILKKPAGANAQYVNNVLGDNTVFDALADALDMKGAGK